MGKSPYASTSDHTELQWLNDGYVIKRGRKGVEKYTSGPSQHTAIYYGESDVRKDEEKAAAILEKRHQEHMKETVEGLVICDELTHGLKDIVMTIPDWLNVGDKVKLIIIKED